MGKTSFSVDMVFKAKDRASRAVGRMSNRFSRFGRVVNGARARVVRFGKAMRKSLPIFAALGAGVGAAALSVAKAGVDFEQAITNVGAVGLRTRDEIQDLEALARRLGATTKFTATEAAQGMEILAKAGFDNQQILKATPAVLNAAAASSLEMAQVADITSNVLKGMGIEAEHASDVVDVLALASSRTNSTIGSLGDSMRNISATARQLGIPLNDTVAAVALLQDVGLDASVAGSSFNTMLTRMAKPPKEIAKQMKKFGISFTDAEGNMKSLGDVVADLNVLAEEQGGNFNKIAFMADLVGLRGQKAAANLGALFQVAEDGSSKFGKLTKELNGARGAAESMANIRMDTLQGDFTKLNSAMESLKITLFETKSGPLRGIVQQFSEVVQFTESWYKNLEKANQTGTSGMQEVWHAFEDIFRNIHWYITSGLKGWGKLFDAIGIDNTFKDIDVPDRERLQREADEQRVQQRMQNILGPMERTETTREQVDVTLRGEGEGTASVRRRGTGKSRVKIERNGNFQFTGG